MLKRFFLTLALALGLPASALASGTIPFSLSQQFDTAGKPLGNCFFYTIQAGTTSTPQNAYQDSALSLVLPNPMRCDAAGRLPQFFLADGLIKVRITDKNGVAQAYPNGANGIDNIQVIGPSGGGGGGGGTVDPTTIFQTGDVKASYSTSTITGWVRMNGRTVGSASSGASERSNADVQALFLYLWGADANLAVSGGRGASAAADWAANKTIALPDGRGRVIAGLDDMGNTAAGRLTATYFGATGGCSGALGTTLGVGCGGESQTLTATQIPTITSANGSQSITVNPVGNQTVAAVAPGFAVSGIQVGPSGAGSIWVPTVGANSWGSQNVFSGTNPINVSSNNTGGTAHPQVPPTMLITYFIKL
jgi:hypothetical protein